MISRREETEKIRESSSLKHPKNKQRLVQEGVDGGHYRLTCWNKRERSRVLYSPCLPCWHLGLTSQNIWTWTRQTLMLNEAQRRKGESISILFCARSSPSPSPLQEDEVGDSLLRQPRYITLAGKISI